MRWAYPEATTGTEDAVMDSPLWEPGRGSASMGTAKGPSSLRARFFLAEAVISAGSPALCVSPLSNEPVGGCQGGGGLGRSPSVTS